MWVSTLQNLPLLTIIPSLAIAAGKTTFKTHQLISYGLFMMLKIRHVSVWMCIVKERFFKNSNQFSLIIFYHSVWLGFELFGLRVQVHSIGYNFCSSAKDMTITIVIINPPDRKWGWSVDDVMPRRDVLRIWKILKKIQLRSDHGVEKLGSDHGVEKLVSDHSVQKSDHGVEGWHWTMEADNWVSAIGA